MKVGVLRLAHRQFRDHRMTTHVALSARAVGAQEFIYTGDKDEKLESTITDVVQRWGGDFVVRHETSAAGFMKKWQGIKIHLTMYGEDHRETLSTLTKHQSENILVIVGGTKVPRHVYSNSDFNTSIGWQPHSEVAALSMFLHELLGDSHLYKRHANAKMNIKKDNLKSTRTARFQ